MDRLDENYVPWEGGQPEPPPNPRRVQMMIYGFAVRAHREAMAMAGAKVGR